MRIINAKYNELLNNIGLTIAQARQNAFKAVNTELVKSKWEIGRRNILDMRRFYLVYPIWQALHAKLSWRHFIALLGVTNDTARKFYENQTVRENWSYRELERQIDSSLFERLALSKDKEDVLKLVEILRNKI